MYFSVPLYITERPCLRDTSGHVAEGEREGGRYVSEGVGEGGGSSRGYGVGHMGYLEYL